MDAKPMQREKIITAMCMTFNHSYGIMEETQRRCLWNKMAQVFDHEIAPYFIADRGYYNGTYLNK